MKHLLLVTFCLLLLGCNQNESKEARIQALESEVEQARIKLEDLRSRVQTIEADDSKPAEAGKAQ